MDILKLKFNKFASPDKPIPFLVYISPVIHSVNANKASNQIVKKVNSQSEMISYIPRKIFSHTKILFEIHNLYHYFTLGSKNL